MGILVILFWMSGFIVFFAMIGYPISLLLIRRIVKPKKMEKNYTYTPLITLIIPAHNEEKVIIDKLRNTSEIEYPKSKIEIIIASDNSTDNTNMLVEEYIKNNPDNNIRLFKVLNRMGKTNAQNEAVATANGEIIVMTDANTMLDKNSVRELVASFTADDIAYVTGKLIYINTDVGISSSSEATYWDLDLTMRKIESDIQTITGGNGAIYACRCKDYYNFAPIRTHDSAMPIHYALEQKRALFNEDAKAYEKAGETIEEEFSRKVRINRGIFHAMMPSIKVLNIFKYKWFTYFYLGHRTARYLLGFSHCLLLMLSLILATQYFIYQALLGLQIVFYTVAIVQHKAKINNKYINMIYYYCVTLLAQIHGAWNIVSGKAKPFWEKAESTRVIE